MDFSLIGALASIGLVSYAIWAIHRLYVVFGKCPRCQRRLERTADVCRACGCRPHEYASEGKAPSASRPTTG